MKAHRRIVATIFLWVAFVATFLLAGWKAAVIAALRVIWIVAELNYHLGGSR